MLGLEHFMTHARRLSSLSLVALLTACTGQPAPAVKPGPAASAPTATPPVATPTVATPPTATPPTATPPTAAPPVADPIPDPSQPWTTLAEGIVPRTLVADVQVAAEEPPILSRVTCDAPQLAGDCNYGRAEILGFDATSVALMYTPESGHPGIWPLTGEIVGLDGKSREHKTITKTGELEGGAYVASRLKGWKWFASQARAGYKPPEPLLWATGTTGVDEAMHAPLVFLKAPLAGWMLHIAAPTGDEMAVQLVTPDNKRALPLAKLAVETADRCLDETAEIVACAKPLRRELPDIDAVALDPGGEHLVVIYTLRAAGSGIDRTRWAIYPLPPEARPQP